jgi:hypothetical protein
MCLERTKCQKAEVMRPFQLQHREHDDGVTKTSTKITHEQQKKQQMRVLAICIRKSLRKLQEIASKLIQSGR